MKKPPLRILLKHCLKKLYLGSLTVSVLRTDGIIIGIYLYSLSVLFLPLSLSVLLFVFIYPF